MRTGAPARVRARGIALLVGMDSCRLDPPPIMKSTADRGFVRFLTLCPTRRSTRPPETNFETRCTARLSASIVSGWSNPTNSHQAFLADLLNADAHKRGAECRPSRWRRSSFSAFGKADIRGDHALKLSTIDHFLVERLDETGSSISRCLRKGGQLAQQVYISPSSF